MAEKPWEKHLATIYYDPKEPASFTSDLKKLDKAVKAKNRFVISKSRIKKWLSAQEIDTSMKGVRRKFKKPRIVLDGSYMLWDADLMDMQDYKSDNDGTRFVLVVIDDFSRRADAEPIANKTAGTVLDALKLVFDRADKLPRVLRTDAGSEFVNGKMKAYLKRMGVRHQVTTNEVKANYAERFIRTLKKKITKFFLKNQSYAYATRLPDFIQSYNATYHSSIKRAPNKVTPKTRDSVYEDLYVYPHWEKMQKNPKSKKRKTRYRFKIGQTVKVSFLKKIFNREYDQQWTSEIFTVVKRILIDDVPAYELVDYAGDPVKGIFYGSELQAVVFDPDRDFAIEKVIKTKGKGKNAQSLVRWLGWPKKYDQWFKTSEIRHLIK